MTAPRYVVYLLLDEPQGDEATHGYATAGTLNVPEPRSVRAVVLLGLFDQVQLAEPAFVHQLFQPYVLRCKT